MFEDHFLNQITDNARPCVWSTSSSEIPIIPPVELKAGSESLSFS